MPRLRSFGVLTSGSAGAGGPGNHLEGTREIEAKFTVGSPSAAMALEDGSALPPGSAVLGAARQIVLDSYLDTEDHALLRAGLALRVRAAFPDGPRKVSLKSTADRAVGAVHDRLEIESAKDAGDVWSRVRAVVGDLSLLRPVLLIQQARTGYSVRMPAVPPAGAPAGAPAQPPDSRSHPAGATALSSGPPPPTGLLSLDRAAIFDPNLPDTPLAHLVEAEVELPPGGDREAFAELVAHLSDLPGLSASQDAKFSSGLRAIARAQPGVRPPRLDVHADMLLGDAARAILRRQLTEMLLNEAGSRIGDDIEYVHDMRVASRRARASLGLYGSAFEKSVLKKITKGLKRTAGALGSVRDLDVALANLALYADGRPSDEQESLRLLAERWTADRQAARTELAAWLDDRRYARFIRRTKRGCAKPDLGASSPSANTAGDAPPPRVCDVVPAALLDQFQRIRRHEAAVEATAAGQRSEALLTALHDLRIECKRLRYMLEPFEEGLGEPGTALVKTLKALQRRLGDLNDAVVTRDRLRGMQAEGFDNASVSVYIEEQEAMIDAGLPGVARVYRPFVGPETRSLLGAVIARL